MSDQVIKEPAGESDQQNLVRVSENLYRSDKSEKYYAIFKRDGKQIRRSLRTTDRQLAQRRLAELREKVDQLDTGDAAKVGFAIFNAKGEIVGGLLRQYIDNKLGNMKSRTRELNIVDAKTFAHWFADKPVRNIAIRDVEEWAAQRQKEVCAETFNRGLKLLRRIFQYAIKHGIRLDNPADKDHIDLAKVSQQEVIPPTKDDFAQLVNEIRRQSDEAADFVEALAYSGCRLSEIGGDKQWGLDKYPPLYWQGEETWVNFQTGKFRVIGKGKGNKRKPRIVPLFPAFRELLVKRLAKLPSPPKPGDRVFEIENPRQSLETACKNLGWHPKRFTNHDMRHFFCSNAIELGFDFKVIAAWLGHSDGGILVGKTYGHLRQQHSDLLAARMTWSIDQTPASNIVDMTAKPNGNACCNDYAVADGDTR